MFDIAQMAGSWVANPYSQLLLLAGLVVLFGIKPGFSGYRWHAKILREEEFAFKCTVAAQSSRQAIKAANDDHFTEDIHVAA